MPGVESHLAARHAPGVDLVAFDEVEFPGVTIEMLAHAVILEILFHGPLDVGADPLDHGGGVGVGAQLAFGDHLVVLLKTQGVHLAVRDQTQLLAPGYGHRGAGGQQGRRQQKHGNHQNSFLAHHFFLQIFSHLPDRSSRHKFNPRPVLLQSGRWWPKLQKTSKPAFHAN